MKNKIEIKSKGMVLINVINDVLGVNVLEERRLKHIVEARRIFSKILRDEGVFLRDIAKALNKSDHTTILNYLNNVDFFIEKDIIFRQKYNQCLKAFHEARGISDFDLLSDMSDTELKNEVIKLRLKIEDLMLQHNKLEVKYREMKDDEDRYGILYKMIRKRCKEKHVYVVERKLNQIFNTINT